MLELLRDGQTKAARLEQILKVSTSSYKYYWLKGLLSEIYEGNLKIPFSRIVARMVAFAWFPVCSYHLSLGATDKLGDLVEYVRQRFDLPNSASAKDIVALIEEASNDDDCLCSMVKNLAKYVPYRVIRPFYEEEVSRGQALLKEQGVGRPDSHANQLILSAMRKGPDRGLYSVETINGEGFALVSADWANYLVDNRPVIEGWLNGKLISYLQVRNPSMPAISQKLRAPVQRDLRLAINYWKDAIDRASLFDIYTGFDFADESFGLEGPLSIDHFIPWSFVMHDEAWNLVPSFRNVNSSKGDHLPRLDKWIKPFCRIQFDAMITMKEQGRFRFHKHYLDSYRQIDSHFDEYVRSEASRSSFEESIENAIKPLWQIASNQGYACWDCASLPMLDMT